MHDALHLKKFAGELCFKLKKRNLMQIGDFFKQFTFESFREKVSDFNHTANSSESKFKLRQKMENRTFLETVKNKRDYCFNHFILK